MESSYTLEYLASCPEVHQWRKEVSRRLQRHWTCLRSDPSIIDMVFDDCLMRCYNRTKDRNLGLMEFKPYLYTSIRNQILYTMQKAKSRKEVSFSDYSKVNLDNDESIASISIYESEEPKLEWDQFSHDAKKVIDAAIGIAKTLDWNLAKLIKTKNLSASRRTGREGSNIVKNKITTVLRKEGWTVDRVKQAFKEVSKSVASL